MKTDKQIKKDFQYYMDHPEEKDPMGIAGPIYRDPYTYYMTKQELDDIIKWANETSSTDGYEITEGNECQ